LERKWETDGMVKKEFLILLKQLSDKLTEKDIKHDMPYCHINKMDFNHIYILIPDFVIFDELDFLTPTFIKEKKGIIYTTIDGIHINFVKTPDDMWGYTFHYYSWNSMHVYIQSLFNYFRIEYDRFGIKYKYKEKDIFLSKNLKEIIEFIGLDFKFYGLGFPTELVINTYIESSQYYDTKNFTMNDFKKIDPMFDLNKRYYYKTFIKNKSESGPEKKTEEEKIALIDVMFPEAEFLKKLYKFQLKENLPENVKINEKQIIENKPLEKPQKKKISLKGFFTKEDDTPEYGLED